MTPAGAALSELGLEGIKAFEACMQALPGRPGYFTTYRDSAGVLTLGWGHTNAAGPPHIGPGAVWTQQACDEALSSDLAKVGISVYDAVRPYWSQMTQSQYDALVSFEYNTGDLSRSSIPAKLAAGSLDEAIATLLLYDHDREGHVLAGLKRRREYEAALMRGNLLGAAQIADVHLQSDQSEQIITAMAVVAPPTFIMPAKPAVDLKVNADASPPTAPAPLAVPSTDPRLEGIAG